MTERDQIDAMAAEYIARGYDVERDVEPSKLNLDIGPGIRLDLVAKLATREVPARHVLRRRLHLRTVVVEIANREGRPRDTSLDRMDEQYRVTRFDKISKAIRDKGDPTIQLLIRFLDVSADQARARSLKTIKVRDRIELENELASTRANLETVRDLDVTIRGTVLVHAWARWLRIMANRFPAARGELKHSDLRTVQKDLFDGRITTLRPGRYYSIHNSVMATLEGGDVSWDDIEQLRRPLDQILNYVEKTVISSTQSSVDDAEDTD